MPEKIPENTEVSAVEQKKPEISGYSMTSDEAIQFVKDKKRYYT